MTGRRLRFICMMGIVALAALFAPAAQRVAAQEIAPLTANVDRTTATTDDIVTLTVVVTALNEISAHPQPPALDGFEIVAIRSSTQFAGVEGNQLRTSTSHVYQLRPLRTGTLIIGPVSAIIDGISHTTQPIVVEVAQGTGQPAPPAPVPPGTDTVLPQETSAGNAFVEVWVDKPAPYLGEQVVYLFRFYEAVDVLRLPDILGARPDYDAPGFTGFWAEGDVTQTNFQTALNGRLYNVSELRTNLFPTTPGVQTIDPARLILPGTPYAREEILTTEPVTVTVKTLPEDAPEGFTGAVGSYEIRTQVNVAEAVAGEPVELTVFLAGSGNLRALADPDWPDLPGWRSYDSGSDVDTQVVDGTVVGMRTYRRMMVPAQAGTAVIPPIEYTFFDPATATYRTAASQPITLTVAPGVGGEPALAAQADAAAAAPAVAAPGPMASAKQAAAVEPVSPLAEPAAAVAGTAFAIGAQMRPAPAEVYRESRTLLRRPGYWALWGAPLAVLVAAALWRRREQRRAASAAARRAARAMTRAHQELNLLRRTPLSSPEQYAGAQRVLTEYLSTRLDRPVAGLTRQGLALLLMRHGVSRELTAHTQEFLRECENGRFGRAAAGAPQDMLQEAQALLRALDATLNPKAVRQQARRRAKQGDGRVGAGV